ncbi:MAG: DUF4349 domain-containing protein [Candidatus Faecousia sp.]|nr:DUF4349 domain-containing protein [Clostridiales bacterium]MDY6181417.1 DUF4349 domain-containing protein [Candidatus Faecousia sp.]
MKARKWISLLVCLVLALGLLSGCGAKNSSYEMAYDSGVAETWAAAEAPMAANGTASLTDTGASTTAVPQSRKWIVTVDMDAETEDLDALLESITSQIESLGGYVEDQRVTNGSRYSTSRYRSASLTVRIPAEDVDSFTQKVSGVCNVVRSSKSLEDVTLTYVATESRMNALQTEEARLLELMEQAETMADLLEIEARLTDVRYELERVTSQLRVYDNLVDYATIYLGIDEVTEYTPVEEETLWQRISGGFVRSLKGLGETLLDVAVWLIVNLPYLVVLAAIGWAIVAITRRLRRKKAVKKAPRKDTKPADQPKNEE